MSKPLSIGAAAMALGVTTSALRHWEAAGRLVPIRTDGGQRRYDLAALRPGHIHGTSRLRRTVAYARVSSYDQREDLERQKQVPESYCAAQGWPFDIITDLGSGINYQKKGLRRLLAEIVAGDAGRLVVTHKGRLLRFGAELVFALCEARNVEVVIISQGADTMFEEDLASDVLEIITVFSARRYSCRSHRNQKLIEGVRRTVQEAQC